MGVNVKNIINSRPGQISISIILGVGLASFFRKACNSRNCLVFQAPSEIQNNFKNLQKDYLQTINNFLSYIDDAAIELVLKRS